MSISRDGDRRTDVLRASVAEHGRDGLLLLRRAVLDDRSCGCADAEVDFEICEIENWQRVELAPDGRTGVVRRELVPEERLRRSWVSETPESASKGYKPSSSSEALESSFAESEEAEDC